MRTEKLIFWREISTEKVGNTGFFYFLYHFTEIRYLLIKIYCKYKIFKLKN